MSDPATGRGIRIAVIDSGVHPQHDHIDASRLLPGASIGGNGTIGTAPEDTLDRLGHGTAVTAAIQEKAPEAFCMPIRVFHDGLKTTGYALITAIDWAIAQGADIINLSLGSTNPAHAPAFAATVERACHAGSIVVAPRAVEDTPCYPGALDGVLSVCLDWDCPRATYRPAPDGSGQFFASGFPRPIPGVPLRRNIHGISFATAQMAGFAACALEGLDTTDRSHGRIEAVRAALCG
ncbi:S8 family peptidase [Novosphingobium album (ex Hu et al. 2023)]|uniref:S8 family serine peptidase n=1 Tax=Novosphingobium album (ex Hu et al. 2023) TaxID=2930093 RepID=A0ABT0B0Y1_9SPHN|nr:S8 family serine peptidase [Novosphingobium album (ex Hu et al. 2023)]MCJ2178697.1 S8 family serine peptidase [Novosphingobium album (ex Hu et al. 2023)]